MADAFPKFRPPELAELAVSYDGLQFWQFMVAGSVAGVVEHTAMFPVDTLKTRMQAQRPPAGSRRVSGGSCPASSSSRPPLSLQRHQRHGARCRPRPCRLLLRLRGLQGVPHRGNPNSVGNPAHPVGYGEPAAAAEGEPLQRGHGLCAQASARGGDEGLLGLLQDHRCDERPFTAVHFSTYEAAKRALTEVSLATAAGDEERLVVHATAGAAAGALAAFVTTPLDVVKTQLQCQGVCGCERFSGGSILEEVRSIVRRDGYVGLARGWRLRMLFHAPAAAVCWSTYEGAKAFFQEVNQTA
ncbi:unnamed protein product [Spirodela intermedia]|uniref:Uncharacterized protein n=1 Tax=Spirodela intermedia TaxID=51605 RepID=A0A7I8IV26_SPIIN|nr:unnamed protein product [Spirodela intermedia]CAA6661847.1 unnamed protein product [Spirodela intermedia]